MNSPQLPEAWMRGPVPSVPALLQPVAHALLQSKEEINELLKDFNGLLLWKRPASLASVGFHLQHIAGVQDRLFTYAKGELLSNRQLEYLQNEGKQNDAVTVADLLENLNLQTSKSIKQLSETDVNTFTAVRGVGRKQISSTVMGLLFHAAEHTMRHTGQLIVTTKILKAEMFWSAKANY